MKNWPFLLGSLIVVLIVAVLFWPDLKERFTTAEPVRVEEPVPAPKEHAIQHPVATIKPVEGPQTSDLGLDQPLPALEESDSRLQDLLPRLFAEQNLDRYFLPEHIVERFVVMVDNLPNAQLPPTHRPLKKIEGEFLVASEEGNLTIAPGNDKRYEPLVRMLQQVDQERAIAVYVRLYPLFQEAYVKLGYPSGYFNDRLVDVIDHLLQAPVISGPICLEKPKFYYQFADPSLEALSAGHKIMLRIGPDNAERVKALLRGYRSKLIGTPVAKP